MRTEFLCISVLRVASGPRVKLASCKSALNPPVVYSTDRSKAVVPVLVLLFVALWFILRGDLFYVLPCVILFLYFSVLLALRLPRLGKRELFVRLFGLCLLDLSVSSSSWCISFRVSFCSCVFFSPFSIAITSLGEERANLNAFRTFVRFALVWFCLFPLPLGVWERLWFVIVALPGLFSYRFLTTWICSSNCRT